MCENSTMKPIISYAMTFNIKLFKIMNSLSVLNICPYIGTGIEILQLESSTIYIRQSDRL